MKAIKRPLTLEDYRRIRGVNLSENATVRKIGFDVSSARGSVSVATSQPPVKSSRPSATPAEDSSSKSTRKVQLTSTGQQQAQEPLPPLPSLSVSSKPSNTTASATASVTSSPTDSPLPLETLKAMPLPLKLPPAVLCAKRPAAVTPETATSLATVKSEAPVVQAVKPVMKSAETIQAQPPSRSLVELLQIVAHGMWFFVSNTGMLERNCVVLFLPD